MTIEEYKEIILHQLEKASDCEKVEWIINHSVERMVSKKLHEKIINNYLYSLREELERLSQNDFDSVHWCNIRCAVIYLKRISEYHKK